MDPSLSTHRGSGLESIDLNQFQGDISKLNSSVLRGIDGNSLQLIIQRNADTEYIEHALLSPNEYIPNHFHNGLIVDLVSQSQDQPIETHHIYENAEPIQITSDRRFIHSNEPTTIQSTLHQPIHVSHEHIQHLDNRNHFHGNQSIDENRRIIITEQSRHYVTGNEAPVIVSSKDATTISSMEDIDLSTTFSNTFSQIDQTVLTDAARISNDDSLMDSKIQTNPLPPLPTLAPITKIQSARRTPSIEQQQHAIQFKVSKPQCNSLPRNGTISKNVCFLTDDDDLNFIQSNVKFGRQPIKEQIIAPKKNLPHKKRIPKKLKSISPTADQMQLQLSDLSYPAHINADVNLQDQQMHLSSPQNVSLNLAMNSQPIQLTTNRLDHSVKQSTYISTNNFETNQNEVQTIQIPVLPFTCQLCGVQTEEQYDFYTHLKLHYEPEKVVTTTPSINIKHETNRNIVRNGTNHAVIESSLILETSNQNIYQLTNDERKLSNGSCIQAAPSVNQVVTINENYVRLQNGTEQDFNCIGGIGTEDITDEDSMNDYNDSGLNAIKAEQNEFSDTEDMLENGVLDKVQRVVDSYIENATGEVKELIEMNEPSHQSNLVENACHWTTSNGNMVYSTIDKNASNTQLIRSTNAFEMETSRQQKEQNNSEVGRAEELTLIYGVNVNDKDFDGIGENSAESILRHQLVKTDNNEINTAHAIEQNQFQQAKADDERKKDKKNGAVNLSESIRANMQDEFIEEEQTDSDADPDKPDAQKKKKKIYRCKRCNKLCNSKNALCYHFLSHTGERPHQCTDCGKCFFASSALKVHKRLHSGDKPYICPECKRPFRQYGDLKYHISSLHTKEKSHQCEFCGKDFARRYSLVLHRRIHTGEKNYKCEFCDKEFRASSYLQVHRKIHTGEKPFNCEVCMKSFRVRGDLKRHFAIHERNKIKDAKTDDGTINTKNELFPLDENNSIQSRSTDTLDQLVSVIENTDEAFANACTNESSSSSSSSKKRNFSQIDLDKGFSKMKFKRDTMNGSAVIINYSSDQATATNQQ